MTRKINNLKKTELYNRLISDKNIYLSIYSLESYVFNRELLEVEDKDILNRLRDKFDEVYISQVIEQVKKVLEKLVVDSNFFIDAKIHFNPKKYEDDKVKFHSFQWGVFL